MKKLVTKLTILTATLLILFANIASAAACSYSHYQPEVPDSLRR